VISSGQFKEHIDELNLTPNIFPAYPPNLPFPDRVHGFVAQNRSPVALHRHRPECRVHGSLRITPAMEAGITDHVWELAELLK
jgi:hypothetical protein